MVQVTGTAGPAVLATRPGETVPTRLTAPSLWRVGNLQAIERAHLAFHRLQARSQGAEKAQSNVRILPLSRSIGTSARASTSYRILPETPTDKALNVLIQEYAAFVGLRNILLGAGWTRIVKTPSPFISTSGAGLAAVLSTRSTAARMAAPPEAAGGILGMLMEAMWVRHPESRLWREVKGALGNLRDTVSELLADQSVWTDDEAAAEAVLRFSDAFNSAIRTLNRAVSIVEGALQRNDFLEGVEAVTIEAVRGPVAGLPDRLDETAEAGLEIEKGAALSLSDLRISAAATGRSIYASGGDPRFSVIRSLERIGVVLENDYTTRFDEAAFRRTYSREPETVRDLFAGETKQGEYSDGLPVLRRLRGVLETLLEPTLGSFRMAEEAASRLAASRPWEAYTKASSDLLGGVLSLLV